MITQLILTIALALHLNAIPARIMYTDHNTMYLAFDQAHYIGVCGPGRIAAIDLGWILALGDTCIAVVPR